MASLADLATIDYDSIKDPEGETNPDVLAAINLRRRICILLYEKAFSLIEATPNPEGQEQREMLMFAQQALGNPEVYTGKVLRMLLVEAPQAATKAQILAVPDDQLRAKLTGARLLALARRL